jgi:hypothetical protein
MVTSELVEKLGLASFIVMSSLIVVCIMLGFYAVLTSIDTQKCEGAPVALS